MRLIVRTMKLGVSPMTPFSISAPLIAGPHAPCPTFLVFRRPRRALFRGSADIRV
jgi:hypothetical protein